MPTPRLEWAIRQQKGLRRCTQIYPVTVFYSKPSNTSTNPTSVHMPRYSSLPSSFLPLSVATLPQPPTVSPFPSLPSVLLPLPSPHTLSHPRSLTSTGVPPSLTCPCLWQHDPHCERQRTVGCWKLSLEPLSSMEEDEVIDVRLLGEVSKTRKNMLVGTFIRPFLKWGICLCVASLNVATTYVGYWGSPSSIVNITWQLYLTHTHICRMYIC